MFKLSPKLAVTAALLTSVYSLSVIAQDTDVPSPQSLYVPLPDDVTPELSQKGQYAVGVKQLNVTNSGQFNVYTQQMYDRPLTLEVWYPATSSDEPVATYVNETRSGKVFSILADATRDSKVAKSDSRFPVIVLSHGYTGYRTIMYYLGEHLASHGYIVVGIDHTDSTNADVDIINGPYNGFPSTLYNRSRDQHFALDAVLNDAFFAAVADPARAGVVGYSMGGFGAVNTIGGCYQFTPEQAGMFTGTQDPAAMAAVQTLLNTCAGGKTSVGDTDARWKAMVALAPWGGQHQLFSAEALAEVDVPALYISGDLDDVSGYEGVRWLYEQSGSQDTYLLTYANARHNIAPHPAPLEAMGNELDVGHYYEPAWSSQTLNLINEHFTLAMMDCYVKEQVSACEYLAPRGSSNQAPVSGKPTAPWKGFDNRYGTGMTLESKKVSAE